MINLTSFINGARDVAKGAATQVEMAAEDMGMEEFDAALDHLRMARETIARAERAVREIAKMAEEASTAFTLENTGTDHFKMHRTN